jgi:hypothetical protein
MSTYWRIACLDCDDEDDGAINHGEEALAKIIRDRQAWEILADSEIDYDIKSYEHVHIHSGFFMRHRGHVLAPVSQYGDIFGVCEGEPNARCALRAHHEGPHSELRECRPGRMEKHQLGWKSYLLDVADNLRKEGKLCIVKDCRNRQTEGVFVGDLCAPCHDYLIGNGQPTSQAFRNAMAHAAKVLAS